jgi:DNA repair protein RecN (Recombination protein N)
MKPTANVLYERERLEWQVNELEKLAVKPGEWSEVSNEHSRLSHAASLLEGAQEALALLSEADEQPSFRSSPPEPEAGQAGRCR